MKIKRVLLKAFAVAAAAVFALPMAACSGGGDGNGSTVKVYMPDGAPAVALASFMDSGYAGAEFTVVPATDIAAYVKNGTADMAIMPINAAAAQYNAGVDIVMLTVNTHGNLFIVGKNTDENITLSDLIGKRVGTIGQGNVPDLTLRLLLDDADIDYEISNTATAGKVAVRYDAAPAMIDAGAVDYLLLAEPAVSTAMTKFSVKIVADVQELWAGAFEYTYPQACLVAKSELVKNDKAYVDKFIADLQKADGWAAANPDKALSAINAHLTEGASPTLQVLNADIVARCNIQTQTAISVINDCDRYFTSLTNLKLELDKPALARVPDVKFYYGAQ